MPRKSLCTLMPCFTVLTGRCSKRHAFAQTEQMEQRVKMVSQEGLECREGVVFQGNVGRVKALPACCVPLNFLWMVATSISS